jgi:hypothetical protein
MKRLFILIIILPSIIFSQYYSNRATEQNFERSEFFFKNYYLNTFGLNSIKNVTAGFFDDPFLNLSINPAKFPQLEKDSSLFYIDFRGDRTKSLVVDQFVTPNYYAADGDAYRQWIDPRWNMITREEPEPIFSVGILSNPFSEFSNDFFIGATYQIIHREEKYYNTPYIIYNSRYGYNASSDKAEGLGNVPVIDRYSSKDEMITTGHLYSAFLGYRITEKVNAGISISGITHKRSGGYLNLNNDEFGNTKSSKWENKQDQNRNQNYHHFDLTAGIKYLFSEKLTAGFKAGLLNGKADQGYGSIDYYLYKYTSTTDASNWSNSFSNSTTTQTWNHDGTYKYAGIDFDFAKSHEKSFHGYYRYTLGAEDFKNTNVIRDTSLYESQWIDSYNKWKYNYNGKGSAVDLRSGNGNRNYNSHEAMINFRWKLNRFSKIILGAYWNKTFSEINDREPAYVYRYSEYRSTSTSQNPYNYYSLSKLKEDKTLVWEYAADYWTIQIPIFLQFDLTENFSLMAGVNRILKGWEIQNKTTAYFNYRERDENGTVKKEINFGERYSEPTKNLTENYTRIVTKFCAYISQLLSVNLLLDPDFENQFRIAQWWLSFEGRL